MNLIRNHIIYAKRQLEEKYGTDSSRYPEIYFRELPPETAGGYMANAAEIRDRAAEILDLYLTDVNFQYLLCNRDMLEKKEAEKISIDNVLRYASELARALKEDDLITMRGHTKGSSGYQEAFAQCAERAKQIIGEKRMEPPGQTEDCQITLFQMGMETGRSR